MESGFSRFGETFDVRLDAQFRAIDSDIEMQICKYVDGQPSDFITEPIHVWFQATESHLSGMDIFKGDVPTTADPCTKWIKLGVDFEQFKDSENLSGWLRITSPSRIESDWMQNCGNPDAGGYCWYSSMTGAMTHTCL